MEDSHLIRWLDYEENIKKQINKEIKECTDIAKEYDDRKEEHGLDMWEIAELLRDLAKRIGIKKEEVE